MNARTAIESASAAPPASPDDASAAPLRAIKEALARTQTEYRMHLEAESRIEWESRGREQAEARLQAEIRARDAAQARVAADAAAASAGTCSARCPALPRCC